MDTLFDVEPVKPRKANPCVGLYGPGPDGKACATCCLMAQRGAWSKCTLRTITKGAGSDHRRTWPACGRYTEEPIVCCLCGAGKAGRVVRYSERDGKAYCLPCYQAQKARIG